MLLEQMHKLLVRQRRNVYFPVGHSDDEIMSYHSAFLLCYTSTTPRPNQPVAVLLPSFLGRFESPRLGYFIQDPKQVKKKVRNTMELPLMSHQSDPLLHEQQTTGKGPGWSSSV